MVFSRRRFSKAILSSFPAAAGALSLSPGIISALAAAERPVPPWAGMSLGLNTWSLRTLKHKRAIPTIISVMKETRMKNCQLLFSHAEPEEFDPDFAAMFSNASKTSPAQYQDQQRRKSEARTEWRLTVPMTYFEGLRSQFEEHSLTIRAYATPLGSSAEEVERVFLMAKTLGAAAVITRLSEAQTDLAAASAERHGLIVGIQFTDPRLLAQQLRASPRLRADPDIGDLTKAGASALDFIQKNLGSISWIDLKDAVAGGGSVRFGAGDAHMRQVLEFLVQARSNADLYIDCDYPGTGDSTEEVVTCVRYVRGVMNGEGT